GIVPIYEIVETGDEFFIVSAFCRGQNLCQWIPEHSPTATTDASWIAARLAEAIAHAHSRGVLHRDLKPANVLLDVDCAQAVEAKVGFLPRVSDFGLAKILADESVHSVGLVGTLQYMSPEQAAGRSHDVGVQTDVWAIGVILYELLSGHPPFDGDG